MSLGIVIISPEGVVLAAESRITLSAKQSSGMQVNINYDNASKVLSFSEAHEQIGAITYGAAGIGFRTAHSFVPEFEQSLDGEKLNVEDFAIKMSNFFLKKWRENSLLARTGSTSDMYFIVAGYNKEEPYGKAYEFSIPSNPKPNKKFTDFGITWGGQKEIIERLLMGYDSRILDILIHEKIVEPKNLPNIREKLNKIQLAIPIQFMPLQDCINLAKLFIRTTIETQDLTIGLRGCGGNIDVAIIQSNKKLNFIRNKELKA